MLNNLNDIFEELELKLNKRILVRRAFERYYNAMRLERTLIAIEDRQLLRDAVERNFKAFEEQGVKEFMERSLTALPETTKKNLVDLESIQAAIIYELLSKCYER